ncbi:MAG: low-complexity tail membrane protein [Leptolyngbyaceae cyanobacterium bins.59]|nr:low-complexity tail membrane protein [Leptolyngbyaceae cyanobacterium bins.59]
MAFRAEPFLWIHLAGVATVPILLGMCLVGLAIGNPVLPRWLELSLLVLFGMGPILWMQVIRPFYIFSILFVSVQPDRLTDTQCRMLTRFRNPVGRVIAGFTSVLLVGTLWQLYYLAPTLTDRIPFQSDLRPVGLLVAAVAFLLVNLFVQVPVSVLHILFTQKAALTATPPYPVEQIRQDFMIPGFWVRQIWPFALNEALHQASPAPSGPHLPEPNLKQTQDLTGEDSSNA